MQEINLTEREQAQLQSALERQIKAIGIENTCEADLNRRACVEMLQRFCQVAVGTVEYRRGH